MIACIRCTIPDSAPDVQAWTLPAALLRVVPRICVDHDVIWADIRGLPMHEVVPAMMRIIAQHRVPEPAIGIAAIPVVARVAAMSAHTRTHARAQTPVRVQRVPPYAAARSAPQTSPQVPVVSVRVGDERAFLAPLPVSVLSPDAVLANLLDGAGVEYCRDLAGLTREAVEVRFGGTGAALWRLARADDVRPIFTAIPRDLPHASLEWTEYTVKRLERLVFVLNGLCGAVCQALRERGEGAVTMTMLFALANRSTYDHPLRAARPTADQTVWMRLIRLDLEHMILPDAVVGITLSAHSVGTLGETQGDLFDRGFGTAPAAESAIAHILDDQGAIVVQPQSNTHALLDRQTNWAVIDPHNAVMTAPQDRFAASAPVAVAPRPAVSSPVTGTVIATPLPARVASRLDARDRLGMAALTLQLLPAPARIRVIAVTRRGEDIPKAYRDDEGMHTVTHVAGPDRISGDWWDRTYARDYFRCVTDGGRLIWMYHDLRNDAWYLHGWWD